MSKYYNQGHVSNLYDWKCQTKKLFEDINVLNIKYRFYLETITLYPKQKQNLLLFINHVVNTRYEVNNFS